MARAGMLANCKCGNNKFFVIIRAVGMKIAVRCSNCGMMYEVNLELIMQINQLG